MKKHSQISIEDFEALLNWFSTDSEKAGIEYEKVRSGLIRFFHFRGCSDPETLADETINRVAKKIDSLYFSDETQKISIFYGFALNIFREHLRHSSSMELQLLPEIPIVETESEAVSDKEVDLEYLERCLKELDENDRDLIIKYFSKDKGAKIELRKKLAKELKISVSTLHVKVHRIKFKLKNCIEECKEKKSL